MLTQTMLNDEIIMDSTWRRLIRALIVSEVFSSLLALNIVILYIHSMQFCMPGQSMLHDANAALFPPSLCNFSNARRESWKLAQARLASLDDLRNGLYNSAIVFQGTKCGTSAPAHLL